MKNTFLNPFLFLLLFMASLWSCKSTEQTASNYQEYDDLYYTAADRAENAERYANNTLKEEVPTYQLADTPNIEFDNENANSDYITRYQESRLYAGDSYGADTYYDPNYLGNSQYPTVGYTDPYRDYYSNHSHVQLWNTWNVYRAPYYGYGWNTWNNPYYRENRWNRWNNGWNNPYYTWNDPYYGWNTWNSPNIGWNTWNCPSYGWGGSNTNVIVLNPVRNNTTSTRYHGPRYNTGANVVTTNSTSRIRIRESRLPSTGEGSGEVGGRPSDNGSPAQTTDITATRTTTRSRVTNNEGQTNSGIYVPSRSTTTSPSRSTTTSPSRSTTTSPNRSTTTSPSRSTTTSPSRSTTTSPSRSTTTSPSRSTTTSPSRSTTTSPSRSTTTSPSRSTTERTRENISPTRTRPR